MFNANISNIYSQGKSQISHKESGKLVKNERTEEGKETTENGEIMVEANTKEYG